MSTPLDMSEMITQKHASLIRLKLIYAVNCLLQALTKAGVKKAEAGAELNFATSGLNFVTSN